MASAPSDSFIPTSRSEAVEMFGDGSGVTVFGGGTVLMPEINAARWRPQTTMFLHRAGLDRIDADGDQVQIGAAATLEDIAESAPSPLADAAIRIADPEVRRLATVGGNLSIPYAGDLQAVLLALEASVAHTGSGGETTEPVLVYLQRLRRGETRLALEVTFSVPTHSSYVRIDRAHAHSYTILAITAVLSNGSIRVAAKGAAPDCRRLGAVEAALAEGADPVVASERSLEDADPFDDVLASSWYRRRVLPGLVHRAVSQVQEANTEL